MADNYNTNFPDAERKCNMLRTLISEFDTACKEGRGGQKGIQYKMKSQLKSLIILMKAVEK